MSPTTAYTLLSCSAFRRRISSLTMPALPGLPPGELMRSTTAWAPPSSSNALQRRDQVLGARLAGGVDLALTSISAVCGPIGPVAWLRCATTASEHGNDGDHEPGQAEEHAPAALAAPVLEIIAHQLLGECGGARRRARRRDGPGRGPRKASGCRGRSSLLSVAVAGASKTTVPAGTPAWIQATSDRNTGRVSGKDTNPRHALLAHVEREQLPRPQGRRRSGRSAARTRRRGSRTGCTPWRLSRNARLPVELGNACAAVPGRRRRAHRSRSANARRLVPLQRRTPAPDPSRPGPCSRTGAPGHPWVTNGRAARRRCARRGARAKACERLHSCAP